MHEMVFFDTEAGTPQGGVISPLLANIALNNIDKELGIVYSKEAKLSKDGLPLYAIKRNYNKKNFRTLIRFADDFVVICDTKKIAQETAEELKPILKKRGLTLSKVKTKVTHASEGFDFVGFHIKVVKSLIKASHIIQPFVHYPDGEIGVVDRKALTTIITPSEKSFKKMKEKLKELFAKHYNNLDLLVLKANQSIRGYCNSKNIWSVSTTFSKLDFYLYKLQSGYGLKKHRNKGWKWIKKTYFHQFTHYNVKTGWAFISPRNSRVMYKFRWFMGRNRQISSFSYSPIPMNYCTDDKQIQTFLKERTEYLLKFKGLDFFSKRDQRLSSSQDHICPICEDSLFNDERLHRHHILPKKIGGGNELQNLVLLHQVCHSSIHGREHHKWQEYLLDFRAKHPIISVGKLKKQDTSVFSFLQPWSEGEEFDSIAFDTNGDRNFGP